MWKLAGFLWNLIAAMCGVFLPLMAALFPPNQTTIGDVWNEYLPNQSDLELFDRDVREGLELAHRAE